MVDVKTQDRIRKFHNGSGTYDVVAKNVKKLTAEVPERVYLQAVMTAYDLDEDQIADALRSLGTDNALIGSAVVSPDAPYCHSGRTHTRFETANSQAEPTVNSKPF